MHRIEALSTAVNGVEHEADHITHEVSIRLRLQLYSAALFSLSHGANASQKAMGIPVRRGALSLWALERLDRCRRAGVTGKVRQVSIV